MKPTISVILAAHDRPESLTRAVDSVLAQTRPAREIIVVNDGERPLPESLDEKVRAAGVPLRTRRLDRPCLPASRNAGMRMADGEVLLLMDDDHELPPDYLARLADLYEADAEGKVHAIGGTVTEPPCALRRRVWDMLMLVFAHTRWRPRRCAARSVVLPARLRGRLRPTQYMTGGTISLRRDAAGLVAFNEDLPGYALGEDRDFSYRATQQLATFSAASLKMHHVPDPPPRRDPQAYGRMIAANLPRIAAGAVEAGVGKWVLLAWNLAGLVLAHAAYAVLGDRRTHWGVLKGMLAGLTSRAAAGIGLRKCAC